MPADPQVALGIADLVIKILAAVGAGTAFLVAIRQYRQGQAWQRSQIVLSLIDSFENNDRIQAACGMIDWDSKTIPMPNGKSLRFRNSMLIGALRVPLMDLQRPEGPVDGSDEPDGAFSEEESFIRDSFDSFFDFFDKVYAFRKANLLLADDYAYFCYWLELVRDIGSYKQSDQIGHAVAEYIEGYRFSGVHKLLDEYRTRPLPLALGRSPTRASAPSLSAPQQPRGAA